MSLRVKTVFILLILIPLGFYTKAYTGLGQIWVQSYAGGMLYEIFWCLFVSLFFSQMSPFRIATGVFAVTSLLEILQLYHHPILETLRKTTTGHMILGSSFDIYDFPHYLAGCLLGYLALLTLRSGKQTP